MLVKRLNKSDVYFLFKENGKEVRINTAHILYIKSSGNYIDLFTEKSTHTVRLNIGKFLDNVPDKLEYVRIHRSYIVRLDKITSKSKNEIILNNSIKIPVSNGYAKILKEIYF